jgi:hypothetical protein
MFPVAYGVFGSETKENWEWFMKMLHKTIGFPPSLVISTDAGMFLEVIHELFHSMLHYLFHLVQP